MSERVQVAFTMKRDDYEAIKERARSEGKTFSAHLRAAVETARYVRERQNQGARFLFQDGDRIQEVWFR